MKNILITIAAICCMLLMAGCTTSEKFTINGTPGTTVYSPNRQPLGVVSPQGNLEVKVPSDAYYGYMLTYNDADDRWTPFAMNLRRDKRKMTKITGEWLGWSAGILATVGCTAAASQSDDTGVLFGVGLGGGICLSQTGLWLSVVCASRMEQLAYNNNFGYLDSQHTNQDIVFKDYSYNTSQFIYTDDSEEASNSDSGDSEKKMTGAKKTKKSGSKQKKTANKKSSTSSASSSAKAKVSISDLAKNVSGSYSGDGLLTLAGNEIDEYSSMALEIRYIDKNTVSVNVIYDDDSYFAEPAEYTVTKGKKGEFILTAKQNKNALITILKSGSFSYIHPAVEIDGDNYILTIRGNRIAE